MIVGKSRSKFSTSEQILPRKKGHELEHLGPTAEAFKGKLGTSCLLVVTRKDWEEKTTKWDNDRESELICLAGHIESKQWHGESPFAVQLTSKNTLLSGTLVFRCEKFTSNQILEVATSLNDSWST